MHIRRTCSGFAVTALTLAFIPLGCGATQDNYTVIEQQPHVPADEPHESELSPEVRREVETCFKQHQGPWRQRKYSARYEANSNERGALADVKLQETTLDDELEQCVRKVIATTTIPERTLRPRSSGPISGGERMRREQRGPLGSHEAQNPLLWGFVIVMEAVELEVVVQVFVGAIAAVGTIAQPQKNPKDECVDKYDACMNTPLGGIQVDKRGTTVCASCLNLCIAQEFWPSGFAITNGWQTCR